MCQLSLLRHDQAENEHTDNSGDLRMHEGGAKEGLSSAHTAFLGMAGQQLGSHYRKGKASDAHRLLLRNQAGVADAGLGCF